MRIVWCTLQFLDYRIPVFEALSKTENVELFLVFNGDINSQSIIDKTKKALGNHAIPLHGEINIGSARTDTFANKGFRIPYQKNLIKTIKDLKPDVMVSDGFFQWSYATLYLRAIKKIPHVMCYERTKHTERNAQGIRRKYRKFASKFIDAYCCSGKLCGEYLTSLGVNKNKMTFGFMVADSLIIEKTDNKNSRLADTSVISSEEKKLTYLFVGQLIDRKGVLELVMVWKDFSRRKNNNVQLAIVGDGNLKNTLRSIIKKEQIETIKLVGKVPYEEIFDFYKAADIFIMPTLEDNWSLVIPEAMGLGLPVMTTIYNGCYPELVKQENGWVFDSLDPKDFLEKLCQSYNVKHKLKEMGKASQEIIKNFTPQTAARSILKACEIAINSKN